MTATSSTESDVDWRRRQTRQLISANMLTLGRSINAMATILNVSHGKLEALLENTGRFDDRTYVITADRTNFYLRPDLREKLTRAGRNLQVLIKEALTRPTAAEREERLRETITHIAHFLGNGKIVMTHEQADAHFYAGIAHLFVGEVAKAQSHFKLARDAYRYFGERENDSKDLSLPLAMATYNGEVADYEGKDKTNMEAADFERTVMNLNAHATTIKSVMTVHDALSVYLECERFTGVSQNLGIQAHLMQLLSRAGGQSLIVRAFVESSPELADLLDDPRYLVLVTENI